ncbi:hypothetical protein [Chryseolinea lacunae]|uniref:BZIP transcription factor n=1 Tax=Chryseolinea lacunae TaxID=2801331 RepID=A0ABS1KUK1_9BACT|nr:hypothetical protein [Chryseolinea lacunae]MBL0743094.1 hypothetical protein [Chryseolinea lacunae]
MKNLKSTFITTLIGMVFTAHFSLAQTWVGGNLSINVADRGIQFYGSGEKIIGTAGYGIQFQTSGSTPQMTLLNSGYLGIGTTTPTQKLTLGGGGKFRIEDPGNAYSNLIYSFATISNYRSGLVLESNAAINFGLNGPNAVGSPFRWLSSDNSTIDYSTNNGELMRLQKDGKLGLGTVAPSSNFHIYVPSTSTPISGLSVDVQSFVNGTNANNSHFFRVRDVGGNTTAFIVKGTGYVGIATANPDAYLTVNGDVHAKSVRVDLNVAGPDYVFESDYKLPSLFELNAFIQQNKHLPEVPSAKEMEKNGLDLGDMNLILLKKVEELTLYTIQQQKDILAQMEMIKNQQRELELLKAKIK